MEIQKTNNNQNNVQKEDQSWRHHTLILNYTARLQRSNQHWTGTKREALVSRTERRTQKSTHPYMAN